MNKRWVLSILVLSLISAAAIRYREIENYTDQVRNLTDMVCDLVATRAQGGSTRDVHDQVFSFLRKYSPDPKSEIMVRNGAHEVGAFSSSSDAKLRYSCQIANTPEYEIVIRAASPAFWGQRLLERLVIIFLALFSLIWLALACLKKARELWVSHVLSAVYQELGLDDNAKSSSSRRSRMIAKLALSPIERLKPAMQDLRTKLEMQQAELKQSQKVIQQLDKEVSRADDFSEVVRLVRHDLKGPLSALKFCGRESGDEVSDVLGKTIATIDKIVSDLDKSHLSTQEAESSSTGKEVVEVAIHEVLQGIRGRAQSQKITLSFIYDPQNLSLISCRPDHFRRVLANLLQNAVESIQGSGSITVRTQRVDGDLSIEVQDDGCGISEENMKKIFSRGVTFGKETGSGLGLHFVQSSISLWGGSIKVISELGQGSTFIVRLPILSSEVHFQAAPPSDKSISILDDDIEIQKPYWYSYNPEAKLFSSPISFMDWFDNHEKISTCLVDLHLRHEANGLDVIRTVADRASLFLMTSDYLNAEALEVAAQYGVSIIPKPLLFSIVTNR